MKEKELRRLHRRDLLELLVEQSREASRLDAALKEKEEELTAAGSAGWMICLIPRISLTRPGLRRWCGSSKGLGILYR